MKGYRGDPKYTEGDSDEETSNGSFSLNLTNWVLQSTDTQIQTQSYFIVVDCFLSFSFFFLQICLKSMDA